MKKVLLSLLGSFLVAAAASAQTPASSLKTTGAPVNVSQSAPPSGAGRACVTTNATHCTWQLLSGIGLLPDPVTPLHGGLGADLSAADVGSLPYFDGTVFKTGGLTFAATAPGDSATAALTLSATDSNGHKSEGKWSFELPGDGASPGDAVLRLDGGEPVLTVKGDNSYLVVGSGAIISTGDTVLRGAAGGAAILRSDTLGGGAHSAEINVGAFDEIDISFIGAAAGGLYITPTFLEPQDDNLQLFGNVAQRWNTIYAGTGRIASLALGSGADGTINLVSDTPGVFGNSFTVEVVVAAGANDDMSAAFVGQALTVTLGKTGGVLDPTKNQAGLIATAITAQVGGITANATGTGLDPITGASGPTNLTGGAESVTSAGGVNAAKYVVSGTIGHTGTCSAAIVVVGGIVTGCTP